MRTVEDSPTAALPGPRPSPALPRPPPPPPSTGWAGAGAKRAARSGPTRPATARPSPAHSSPAKLRLRVDGMMRSPSALPPPSEPRLCRRLVAVVPSNPGPADALRRPAAAASASAGNRRDRRREGEELGLRHEATERSFRRVGTARLGAGTVLRGAAWGLSMAAYATQTGGHRSVGGAAPPLARKKIGIAIRKSQVMAVLRIFSFFSCVISSAHPSLTESHGRSRCCHDAVTLGHGNECRIGESPRRRAAPMVKSRGREASLFGANRPTLAGVLLSGSQPWHGKETAPAPIHRPAWQVASAKPWYGKETVPAPINRPAWQVVSANPGMERKRLPRLLTARHGKSFQHCDSIFSAAPRCTVRSGCCLRCRPAERALLRLLATGR